MRALQVHGHHVRLDAEVAGTETARHEGTARPLAMVYLAERRRPARRLPAMRALQERVEPGATRRHANPARRLPAMRALQDLLVNDGPRYVEYRHGDCPP